MDVLEWQHDPNSCLSPLWFKWFSIKLFSYKWFLFKLFLLNLKLLIPLDMSEVRYLNHWYLWFNNLLLLAQSCTYGVSQSNPKDLQNQAKNTLCVAWRKVDMDWSKLQGNGIRSLNSSWPNINLKRHPHIIVCLWWNVIMVNPSYFSCMLMICLLSKRQDKDSCSKEGIEQILFPKRMLWMSQEEYIKKIPWVVQHA